ncbi:AAA family ATPase [Pseudorhodoplanes sp.]|uniref:AAA family ATPase n=1 Tax=Pseudorhodoplanes sp. TaxID=1934341 RepID=UPI003D0C2F1E
MNQRMTNLQPSAMPTRQAPPPFSIRMPGQFICPRGYVFASLEHVVHRHLFRNSIPSLMESADRYLAITGEPGASKTVTACDGALRFGFACAHLPGAMLASENEGGATATLKDFFETVVASSAAARVRHVAVIDDLELSILSSDAKTGRTINTALLTGELQRLADRPKPYRNHDGTVIPVIFTGNDFTQIRASLLRDARATSYVHTPTFEEKFAFAFHQLRPRNRRQLKFVKRIARTYRQQPIAFWSALGNDLHTARLDHLIHQGIRDPLVAEHELAHATPLDPGLVWRLAKARAQKSRRAYL